jgi:hypothetical protein
VEFGMMQDFIYAVLLLLAGLVILGIGAYSAIHQKVYFDASKKTVATEVDIPLLGKLKTNAPAIALCFIGLVPLLLGYNQMKNRNPTLVKFEGEVNKDPNSIQGMNAITVGITSGLWSQTETPDGSPQMNVALSVPDSWPSYTAYAFALGGPQTRPAIIGTSLGEPKFKLRIGP